MKPAKLTTDIYLSGYTLSMRPFGVFQLSEAQLQMTLTHTWHAHPQHQALWVLSGTMGMESDRARLRCGAGQACVMHAGVEHALYRPKDSRDEQAMILDLRLMEKGEKSSELTRYVSDLDGTRELTGDAARWRSLAGDLRDAARDDDTPARAARVMSVLWALLSDLSAKQDVKQTGGRVRRAEQVMTEKLGDTSLNVDEIARVVGLSRSQLTRLFMQQRQTGPAERLRHLRVERARVLLTTSTLSVKEIARLCGFERTSHMTRVFRAVTGQTPTEHRDAAVV